MRKVKSSKSLALGFWLRGSIFPFSSKVTEFLPPHGGVSEVRYQNAADDTTAPTLSPGKGRTQTGRYWTYVRDGRPWGDTTAPAVWLQYSEDRRSIHPTAHLRGYKGSLQADAYAGYNELYQRQITQHGCWAHVRRKFYDITQTGPSPLADEAITAIQSLYVIEKQARGQPPDERQHIRGIHAKPILERFHIWLQTTLRTLSKGSPLSK